MKEVLKYKGYEGSIEFDTDDEILFGKILFINDLVLYEGNTIAELKKDFKLAVDDYIETCRAIDKVPQKSYSGTFNIRIGNEAHHILAQEAELHDVTLNSYIKEILDDYIKNSILNTKTSDPKQKI